MLWACLLVFRPGIGQHLGESEVSLLAVGDINLGRHVGQMLLRDSLGYPFEHVRGFFSEFDMVFGNLESQISDQNGETQHPSDRFIFCAPPQAALALKQGGVSVVATANNHAFDYKMKGLSETISYLDEAGVSLTGTSVDSVGMFPPAILERNGIRVGFVAYAQFVNRKTGWNGHIALFMEHRVQEEIAALRLRVDFIVASFHGGDEYKDTPNRRSVQQMRALVDFGADVVVGHHPHVPQGVEHYKGKWIFYSLGNFVFSQPQRVWTQRGLAASLLLRKTSGETRIASAILYPVTAGFQPSFEIDEEMRRETHDRLKGLSLFPIERKDTVFVVQHINVTQ